LEPERPLAVVAFALGGSSMNEHRTAVILFGKGAEQYSEADFGDLTAAFEVCEWGANSRISGTRSAKNLKCFLRGVELLEIG
jgi:hypothetical protein